MRIEKLRTNGVIKKLLPSVRSREKMSVGYIIGVLPIHAS